jgi:Tol biopolymer transport system component
MRHTFVCRKTVAPFAVLVVAGCAEMPSASSVIDGGGARLQFAHSEWSAPVVLPAPINLPTSNEQGPAISPDGLSLYFCSNRPPQSLGNDLWVSRRASESDPWGEPVNLTILNSAAGDCGPSLSQDGTMLFFTSARPGGAGGNDIYMATRADPSDDLSWSLPVRLGPEINTPSTEFSPFIARYRDAECDENGCTDAWAELYFERGATNTGSDVLVVRIDASGTALAAAVPLDEINSPAGDLHPTIRFDGREMILSSNRDGRGGNFDLFVSRRQSPNHPWSTPEPIDELNVGNRHEIHPYFARDGRTVFFIRGTGTANDVWMSTRTPSGPR